jgi:hypothetical protein
MREGICLFLCTGSGTGSGTGTGSRHTVGVSSTLWTHCRGFSDFVATESICVDTLSIFVATKSKQNGFPERFTDNFVALSA